MKKLRKVLFSFIMALSLAFTCLLFIGHNAVTYAESGNSATALKIQSYLMDFVQTSLPDNQKTRAGRIPGSEAEYNSAMYIKSKMSEFDNFYAVTDASTVDGVQQFEFISEVNGNKKISQNIIYIRPSAIETDKKVVICAHYDSTCVITDQQNGSVVYLESDGLNDNAGSVATLLSIANSINQLAIDPGFDIEIVFFGASTNSHAGSSFYLRGLNDDDISNILLVINLDKISVGAHNYFYVNEFDTPQESYFVKLFTEKTDIKQLNTVNANNQSYPNDELLGLGYRHVGMQSDNAIFMSRKINTLNFFSGDYESFRLSETEFANISNITYTSNDNYFYVMSNYENVLSNLENYHDAIMTLLAENDFVKEMQKNNNLDTNYGFWTNKKLAVFITSIIFIVFVFVMYVIYMVLRNNSRKAVSEDGLEQLIIRIAKNVGEDDINDLNDLFEQNSLVPEKSDNNDKNAEENEAEDKKDTEKSDKEEKK
ncbi:MAG: M28 family peptidase [Clostridia bacterium]|nr:M28 family peptidase [Clostridia bacterium]